MFLFLPLLSNALLKVFHAYRAIFKHSLPLFSMVLGVITDIGQMGLWIQGLGLVVIIWIIVQAITMFFNRKRRLLLMSIDERLERVEGKIDKMNRK